MTLAPWHLLALLATLLLVGGVALRALGITWSSDRLGWPAWAFLIGTATCGIVTFAWVLAGKPFAGVALAPAAAALALLLSPLAARRVPAAPSESNPGTAAGRLLLTAVLVCVSVQAFDRAVATTAAPLLDGDGAAIWAAKARLFLAHETLGSDFAREARVTVLAPEYPPLVPLLITWTWAAHGSPLAVEAPLLVSTFVLALAFALAAAVRRVAGPAAAALAVLLVHTTRAVQESGFVAQADVAQATALLVMVDGWLRWRADARRGAGDAPSSQRAPHRAWWRLSCAAGLALVLTKSEGTAQWLVFVLVLAAGHFLARTRRWLPRNGAAWELVPILGIASVQVFNRAFGFAPDHFGGDLPFGIDDDRSMPERLLAQLPERLVPILTALVTQDLLHPEHFRWLPAAFVVTLLAAPRTTFTAASAPLVATVLGTAAIYTCILVASPYPTLQLVDSAVWRIVFHLVPLCALGIALACRGPASEQRAPPEPSHFGVSSAPRPPDAVGMLRLAVVLASLSFAPLLAQDRVVLKSGRCLEGDVLSRDARAVVLVDSEIGTVRVPRVHVREVSTAGAPASLFAIDPPAGEHEEPATYIRWVRGSAHDAGGLETGSARWFHPPSDTTLFTVGVVHIGDPGYFAELQTVLDSCDVVLFEGVGRGEASAEDLARMDVLLKMQLALKGALGLGFQKDWIDYDRDFWRNSDVGFDELQRELLRRDAALPTDHPMVRALLGRVMESVDPQRIGHPALAGRLKRTVGPLLAQADRILQREGFAGMRAAVIEFRNAAVLHDVDELLADAPPGRRIAVFYGAGHLPHFHDALRERGFVHQGVAWHRAWALDPEPEDLVDRRALDAVVRTAIEAHGADLEVGAWLGTSRGPLWGFREHEPRAVASAIKSAFLVELFAAYAGNLDEPLPGVAAILDADDHPALEPFPESAREAIDAALRGASVRAIARMMVRGTGVSNAVYNAAANVTTAALGGPAELTKRLTVRFGPGAAVRRYMLAPRDVTGDNTATPAFLGRVLQRLAARDVPGADARLVAAMRDQMFVRADRDGRRHYAKGGALSSDPLTRIRSGWTEGPTGADDIVFVVMCEQPDPGEVDRARAGDRLAATCRSLEQALLDALRTQRSGR